MPEYNKHRDSFPYMAAVQKEIMRFRPTTNFGIPHAVTEESKLSIGT
jgi:cytochrome P450